MKKQNLLVALVVAATMMAGSFTASAQTVPEYFDLEFPVDFGSTMESVIGVFNNELSFLADLLGEEAELINQFDPAIADLNGPWDEVNDLPGPNGMLDAYELAVVAEMANNPDIYGPEVRDTLIANYQALYTSCWISGDCPGGVYIDPDNPVTGLHDLVTVLLPQLWFILPGAIGWDAAEQGPFPTWSSVRDAVFETFPNLALILAGFATIGDDDTMQPVLMLAELMGFCGLLEEGVCLVDLVPPQTADGYVRLPLSFAPDADPDDDGFTNRQTYDCFVVDQGSAISLYVQAVLDADVAPLLIDGPPVAGLEENVTLAADLACGQALDYQWYKNGVLLEDETGNSLTILNANETDTGWYRVDVNVELADPDKGLDFYSALFFLEVKDTAMPVGSAFGLMMLAGACAVAGVAGLRRRK